MDRPFLVLGNRIINVQAISYLEVGNNGNASMWISNRTEPIPLNQSDADALLSVLSRFAMQVRNP